LIKGDTAPLPVFLVNDKNHTDLNFSHFFCELGLKMLGPQQWQLLHVEKDDQVIRHNNNKTWEAEEKSIRKAFLFKTLVKNCSTEKYLFSFAGSVLFSLLCVYYFCTIFVIHQNFSLPL
jgi:hypothetical protein